MTLSERARTIARTLNQDPDDPWVKKYMDAVESELKAAVEEAIKVTWQAGWDCAAEEVAERENEAYEKAAQVADKRVDEAMKAAYLDAAKIAQEHKCSSLCADRGMGVTCDMEIAEKLRQRASE